MKRSGNITALIIMGFTMFVLGGLSSTKGIVLDEVKKDIGLDLNQFGLVVFIFQWGFTLASVVIGYLVDKKGLKLMIIIGSIIMGAGLFGTGSAQTILFFLGFYMIVGFGLGAMTVASNAIVPSVYPDKQGLMFNLTMGVYGLGMFATPLILRWMFSSNISWRVFYIGIAILLVGLILFVLLTKVPDGKADRASLSAFKVMLKNAQFIFVMFILIFYVSSEVSFLNFFPSYLKSLNLSGMSMSDKGKLATTILSIFSLLFTIGRLGGGWIAEKIGEKKTILIFAFLSVATVLISKFFADQWVYLFAAAGLFFSVLFPTATAIGTKLSETGGSALGLVYVASGIGGAFAGWLVGAVSEKFGSAAGFNLPIIFLAILLIFSFFVKDVPDDKAKTTNA
ncbi:MFS transporter [Fictibacillus enclensis]|uniref:MFS transporter n=1 Tax=Fictibacillus enclensis TaxID=1017270 RepID=UPI0024BFF267|nr:MFS transporter [Fictibacillus enclensis]MDM5201454.1 MFS transporter [Fictibacillus enclensis]WHY72287.1 MFS transporter [Fictibacillus enclensis]